LPSTHCLPQAAGCRSCPYERATASKLLLAKQTAKCPLPSTATSAAAGAVRWRSGGRAGALRSTLRLPSGRLSRPIS
jgi:hypothetical protein